VTVRSKTRRRATCGALACVTLAAPAAPAAADDPRPRGEPDPRVERLSDERGRTYWSTVTRAVSVRARPGRRARRTGALRRLTYYGDPDVVLALRRSGRWTHVRYSGLGRRTGWVPSSAISRPRLNRTSIVIDRRTKHLRAYRDGRLVLKARIGVGAVGSPTPGGRFYIRERLVPSSPNGTYGALAFGLSAYSRHRTDWPGGGQVGIHGTNAPQLIPGRISNGCIRLRNAEVLRLGRIVGRGTPVRIR
jgi:lipoprotein-anchoring transpeptidase ErfK/SrfK